MAKERLSKSQKWILRRCFEKKMIQRSDVREFYAKTYPPSTKDKELDPHELKRTDKSMLEERQEERRKFDSEQRKWTNETYLHRFYVVKEQYVTTKAEEVTISRTLKNLMNKGSLEQIGKRGAYFLTEKGYRIAHIFYNGVTFLSYKQYKDAIDEQIAEEERRYEASINSFKPPSEEYRKKALEYNAMLKEYEKRFNPKSMSELCCDKCQEKIVQLQKESGVVELIALKQELEELR